MTDKVYTISEIRDSLHPVFVKHGVKSAILFGSYAKGKATPKSDVDLVVDSDKQGLAFCEILADALDVLNKDIHMFASYEIPIGGVAESEIKKCGVKLF